MSFFKKIDIAYKGRSCFKRIIFKNKYVLIKLLSANEINFLKYDHSINRFLWPTNKKNKDTRFNAFTYFFCIRSAFKFYKFFFPWKTTYIEKLKLLSLLNIVHVQFFTMLTTWFHNHCERFFKYLFYSQKLLIQKQYEWKISDYSQSLDFSLQLQSDSSCTLLNWVCT